MINHVKELLTLYQYDQIIDRTYLMQEIINNTLVQHPICKVEQKLSEQIENAMNSLLEASQIAIKLKNESVDKNNKLEMEITEKYDPYCKICNACGEDGCCSALQCKFKDGCKYKKAYLNDLKEGYIFMKEFYEKVYAKLDDDLKNEVDELYIKV